MVCSALQNVVVFGVKTDDDDSGEGVDSKDLTYLVSSRWRGGFCDNNSTRHCYWIEV